MKIKCILLLILIITYSCSDKSDSISTNPENTINFYYGADLSYVNEMEDCGAIYKNLNWEIQDPYTIFKNEGANLVRLRLWHNPNQLKLSNTFFL